MLDIDLMNFRHVETILSCQQETFFANKRHRLYAVCASKVAPDDSYQPWKEEYGISERKPTSGANSV